MSEPVGTPEWMRQMVDDTSKRAVAELDEIMRKAVREAKIIPRDAPRVMATLEIVQSQSFTLGVSKGIHLVLDAMGRRRKA